MPLYPAARPQGDAKWGDQTFSDPNYVPRVLDSVDDARARMLAALEDVESYDAKGELQQPKVLAAALNGSDEVRTVTVMLEEILAERAVLAAVPVDVEEKYRAAIAAKAVYLDVDKWVAGKTAELGGTLAAPSPDTLEK
jgi:hypothetical protein